MGLENGIEKVERLSSRNERDDIEARVAVRPPEWAAKEAVEQC
jgi:hypothetical protein